MSLSGNVSSLGNDYLGTSAAILPVSGLAFRVRKFGKMEEFDAGPGKSVLQRSRISKSEGKFGGKRSSRGRAVCPFL